MLYIYILYPSPLATVFIAYMQENAAYPQSLKVQTLLQNLKWSLASFIRGRVASSYFTSYSTFITNQSLFVFSFLSWKILTCYIRFPTFSELFTASFLYFLSYPLDKLPCLYLQTTEWLINIHQHVHEGSFLLCDILYYTSLQPLPLHLRRRRVCGISSPSLWLFVRCYSVRSSCNHSRSSNGFICVRNIPNCTPRLSHKFVYNLTAFSFFSSLPDLSAGLESAGHSTTTAHWLLRGNVSFFS